jgi:uncharacterized oligopeptide transporter (OPT) family protein
MRIGLVVVTPGAGGFILGTLGVFGLDRSQVTGFVSSVFLVGLAMTWAVMSPSLWNGRPKPSADIGYRLVATGVCHQRRFGMADVLLWQRFRSTSLFGLQAIGVMIGQIAIAVGFVLLIHSARKSARKGIRRTIHKSIAPSAAPPNNQLPKTFRPAVGTPASGSSSS